MNGLVLNALQQTLEVPSMTVVAGLLSALIAVVVWIGLKVISTQEGMSKSLQEVVTLVKGTGDGADNGLVHEVNRLRKWRHELVAPVLSSHADVIDGLQHDFTNLTQQLNEKNKETA